MKSFNETITEENYIKLNESDFSYLNESQKDDVQEILMKFGDKRIGELDEGVLGSIIGGLSGFIVGPAIGKVIANSLGIQHGILYDMLTSRLVGAALGTAVTKYIGGSKR